MSDFVKSTHIIYYTAEALQEAAPWIEKLARAEGLEAHARTVSIRRREDGQDSVD